MSEESTSADRPVVWILVDHSSREAAFQSVAEIVEDEGAETQIVTITEVIGNVARDALAGGAERLLRGLRVAVKGRSGDEDFIGAVRRARPDVLAVTDARYVRALGLLESLTGTSSLQVGVLADYNLSPEWTRSSLQGFVVPHEEMRERLGDRGFATERVLVAGPPIQKRFATDVDADAERESLGFGDDETILLVRADTIEPAMVEKLVFQATLVEGDVKFVFHHDGDGTTAATLRRAADQYGLRAVMFGRVPDLERYVAACDAVIASPREPYMAEIVAFDRPLLLVGPPGDAAEQVEFLSRRGVASHVADVLRLGSELDRFLTEESLAAAGAAGAELSANTGSREVAEALLEALEQRSAWMGAAPTSTEGPEDDTGDGEEGPGDDEEEVPAGPFEPIGGGGGGGEERPPTDGGRDGGPRSFSGLSKAEAKEQLAALILEEREIERELTDLEKQQERWRNRLELAREWEEDDLAEEAKGILRGYIDEAERLQQDMESIRRQKDKLKEAAGARRGGGAPTEEEDGKPSASRLAQIEKRFRKMEVDTDLDDLKDRIKRELGES